MDTICTSKQKGLLVSVRQKEVFGFWEYTKLTCKVSNYSVEVVDSVNVMNSKSSRVFLEIQCPYSEQVKYEAVLTAREAFSVYNKYDTICYFAGKPQF